MDDGKNYRVGYKKPPREHSFKKGKTPNPFGRGRKKVEQVSASVDQIILEEANEPIKVREGERLTKIPAIRAALRQQTRAAVKGDQKAANNLIDRARSAERELHKKNQKLFEAAVAYKDEGEDYQNGQRVRGVEPPPLIPHPDDILIDELTCSVRLSKRAQNGSRQSHLILQLFIDQLREQSDVLKALLEADPKNEFIEQDLRKSENLLSRIEQSFRR